MIGDAVRGVGCFTAGLRMLSQPGLRRYVVGPLLLNAVLFTALIWFGAAGFADLVDWLLSPLPGWLDWLRYLLWPLFALTALIAIFFTFSLIANLIGAPFNGLLAEAVERRLTGQRVEDSGGWKRIIADIVPALLGELRKLGYFVLRAVPLAILFLIPGLNLAAPFLWAAFGAWMLAIEYGDFPMGNHDIRFVAQREILRRRRGLALGFGGAAMVTTLIPFVNFLVMPAAVAGATQLWVRHLREEHGRRLHQEPQVRPQRHPDTP